MSDLPELSHAAPDYRLLFEAAPAPLLALSPELRVLALNQAMRALLPVLPDDGAPAGWAIAELLPALAAPCAQLLDTGVAASVEADLGDGAARLLQLAPVLGRNGAIVQIIVSSAPCAAAPKNRPQRLRGVAALRESAAKFRTIADALPQMVWSTLPDGFHDYYNAQWYIFTGMPRGSTDGDGWNGIFHPDDQERSRQAWQASLASGRNYEIQYRLRHHSGAYRWVLGRALPVFDESGAIIRWMGTCTDIHDQKLA